MNKGMCENWKQIEGFENYEVSDHGRVINRTTNKFVKPYQDNGRMAVTLYANNKKFGRRLHNLVAHEFVSSHQHKEYVYNANSDTTNCRSDNLLWISGQDCNKLGPQQMVIKEMLEELKGYHRLVVASNS